MIVVVVGNDDASLVNVPSLIAENNQIKLIRILENEINVPIGSSDVLAIGVRDSPFVPIIGDNDGEVTKRS